MEEAANMGPSNRLIEEEGLHKLLSPIGLRMKDIKVEGMAREREGWGRRGISS